MNWIISLSLLILIRASLDADCMLTQSIDQIPNSQDTVLSCTLSSDIKYNQLFQKKYSVTLIGANIQPSATIEVDSQQIAPLQSDTPGGVNIQLSLPASRRHRRTHSVKMPLTIMQEATSIGVIWKTSSLKPKEEVKDYFYASFGKGYKIEANCDIGVLSVLIDNSQVAWMDSEMTIGLPKGVSISPQKRGPCKVPISKSDIQESIECEVSSTFIKLFKVKSVNTPTTYDPATLQFKLGSLICKFDDNDHQKIYNRPAYSQETNKGSKSAHRNMDEYPAQQNVVANEECSSTKFWDPDEAECVDCSVNCLECTSYTTCSSCKDGSTLKNSLCQSNMACSYYSFGTPTGCRQCPEGCNSCLSEYYCLTCFPTFALIKNLCKCPEHYSSYGSVCLECPQGYSACNGINYCKSCKENYELIDGECLYTGCSDGEYDDFDSDGITCIKCQSPCSKCLSKYHCTECKEDHELVDGRCYLKCDIGYYSVLDFDGEYCERCPDRCAACANGIKCTSCNEGFTFDHNECFSCPESQVGTIINGHSICYDIPFHCIQYYIHSSYIQCSYCEENYHAIIQDSGSRCEMKCLPGYHDDMSTYDRECIPCPNHCVSCFETRCNKCEEGYSQDWSYNDCRMINCRKGQYNEVINNQDFCLNCPANCLECTNFFDCVKCKDGYYNVLGICKSSICKDGEYHDVATDDNICLSCSPHCLNCYSNKACEKCEDGYNSYIEGCLEICDDGEYSSKSGCMPCSNGCLKCNYRDECSKCESEYTLIDLKCVLPSPECPINEFWSGVSCKSCSENCVQCNETTCKKCKRYFYLINGTCAESCPSGYYKSEYLSNYYPSRSCSKCQNNCESCIDDYHCNRCITSDFHLVNGKCICKVYVNTIVLLQIKVAQFVEKTTSIIAIIMNVISVNCTKIRQSIQA